jgi:hypothetical protein
MRVATLCAASRICASDSPAWVATRAPESDLRRALLHRSHGGVDAALDAVDQLGDLLRRGRHPLGELAHLVGHHREAAPLLAVARGLDCGVQRQQVRLRGDVPDGGDRFCRSPASARPAARSSG